MLPELGKYAAEVLSAYAVSLFILLVFIGRTLQRGRKARAALAAIEAEVKSDG